MKYFLIISFFIFAFSSCAVYSPNAVNVPLLKQKGDVALVVAAGNGANVQGAYGISKNIGVMVNYMNIKNETTVNADLRKGNANLLEAAIGYYMPGKWTFEVYGGGGFGNVNIDKTTSNTNLRNFQVKGSKFFIQPSIGKAGKYFEFAFTPRINFVKYGSPSSTYTSDDLKADMFINIDEPLWAFIEPTFTLRGGIEKLKFQLQIGKSFKANSKELGYESGILNFGLFGRL